MDKLTYSTDTTAVVSGAALSAARSNLAASSARANALPVTEPPAATPTPQTASSTIPSPNTGYFGGGYSTGIESTMDKVTYSTDTTAAVPGAALSVARNSLAATGNSTAGYFGGGGSSGYESTMDKVTYASDTTAAVPGAALSDARSGLAATGNSTAGYFSGTTMDKVTYASDTTAAVPGANLSVARGGVAATGNSTAGYFGGGTNSSLSPKIVSTMDKVTYASDTTAAVPGAALSGVRYVLAATGNSEAGYFGGGFKTPPQFLYSTMDKLTYSTDTRTTVPGAALSAPRYSLAATGNSEAGYFGGGVGPDPSSPFTTKVATVDKLTYSSETTAAVPGANLSVARQGVAASSARANGLPTTVFSSVIV